MNLFAKTAFAFFLSIPLLVTAQQPDTLKLKMPEIRGVLLDAETNDPLPYANIVIQRMNKGTISNESGEFSLDTTGVLADDSISFQYIGYKTITIPISQLGSNPLVKMNEDIQNLNKVFVFGSPPNAKDIIKKVIENREKNYAKKLNTSNVFFRLRNTEDVTHMKLKYKKSTISVLDEAMIQELEDKTPKHTTSYTDLLGNILYSPVKVDSVKYKLDPIKTVSLKEKEVADMEMIESVFTEVFSGTKEDEYWKLKTGVFGTEMDVTETEDDTASNKKPTRPENSRRTNGSFYSIKNAIRYSQLTNEDDWQFLYSPGKYKYELVGGTNVGPEDVYIIDFTPKGGDFIGRVYISVETYALIRADYAYAPGKTGTSIHLLGIGYEENAFTGSVLFKKVDSTYSLIYCAKRTGELVSVDRNFSIMKKRERFLIDKTLKEIKLGLDLVVESDNSFELLVLSRKSLSNQGFKSFKQKKYHPITYVDQFDDSLWEGYSIIQPTQKMREYKKREEQ